ncbi:heptaprenyl diphosphate synthase component 1 [Paenibacillus herberti]|uniref:Heptaprenyl diphosphate synthase n=1 Tax=Paenibacillus herberti TaxID=1619309 RepID=A0A229P3F2_9BACL|nr:heptaprenyl diphosphate synthase component 1 [Paenibacillus herberti]OXM16648.1 heptaprenyl diphosphate synthase [Paenibacillus herberti]
MTDYRIPDLAKKYTKHDMIQRYADLPPFPDARIRLLSSFLQYGPAAEHREVQSLAVSLVQLGLDTHDEVDIEAGERGMMQMRQRQLRVLAGDYFSGRFYQLLAGAGQIEMIQRLSRAICEANLFKTDLYQRIKRGQLPSEDYLELQSNIRGELLLSFSELIEERLKPAWEELVRTLSRLEVLSEERNKLDHSGSFYDGWGYWFVVEHGESQDKRMLQEEAKRGAGVAALMIKKYGLASLLADKLGACAAQFGQLAGSLVPAKLAKETALIGEMLLRPAAGAAAGAAGEVR